MLKAFRIALVVALGSLTLIATTAAASASSSGKGKAYVCTGGDVPAGTYHSVVVTGICYMPVGTIVIRDNLTIAPGALLDAVTPGDPTDNPLLPATVKVGGNVLVGPGAVLVLGCSPNNGCDAVTYDHIGGNVTALGALAVVIHSASIGGSVSLLGGGGGAAGGAGSGACFTSPIPAPWSEDPALSNPTTGSPQYSDFEDDTIGGNLSVIGMQTCWLGSFRDQVGGRFTFVSDATSDPDGMELGSNLVGSDMVCAANDPAVQFGDSFASPNIVGRKAFGQCGFKVVLPNPAPEAGLGTGIPEHITVSKAKLKTYKGTHTQVGPSTTVPLGPNVTASGDTLIVQLNNAVLKGMGLKGPITLTPGAPLGSTGETVLATVHPDGSEQFTAVDNCACKFNGKSGAVTIRAYGTVTAKGFVSGTFLVTSGGLGFGELATLAGYGTFTNKGQPAGTLRLVEHLALTGSSSIGSTAGPALQPRWNSELYRQPAKSG